MIFLLLLAICAQSRRLYMVSFDNIIKADKVEDKALNSTQFTDGCVHAFSHGGYIHYGEDIMDDF